MPQSSVQWYSPAWLHPLSGHKPSEFFLRTPATDTPTCSLSTSLSITQPGKRSVKTNVNQRRSVWYHFDWQDTCWSTCWRTCNLSALSHWIGEQYLYQSPIRAIPLEDVPLNNILEWLNTSLRPPRRVCEACLHQVHKPCDSGAISSQTYGNVWWWSP